MSVAAAVLAEDSSKSARSLPEAALIFVPFSGHVTQYAVSSAASAASYLQLVWPEPLALSRGMRRITFDIVPMHPCMPHCAVFLRWQVNPKRSSSLQGGVTRCYNTWHWRQQQQQKDPCQGMLCCVAS